MIVGRAVVLALALVSAACGGTRVVKRPVPDYDGRGAPPTTAGDVALWVPRVLLAPLWFTSEFLIRRPIGWLVVTGEERQWTTRIISFLQTRSALLPTFFVELRLKPSVGLYYFFSDFGAKGNELRAAASIGQSSLAGTVSDRFRREGSRWEFAIRASAARRTDSVFFGLGPDTRDADISRYEIRRFEASVAIMRWLGGRSRARFEAGARSIGFSDRGCCDDPSISERAATGAFELPPGLDGYAGPFTHLQLGFDSRERVPGTGVRLDLDADHGGDLARGHHWVRLGATLGGSIGVGRGRVFSLVLDGHVAEPLVGARDEIPFTELVWLGGKNGLPGFMAARLIGSSSVTATLSYEWPVWVWVGGVLHVATGNVFGADFAGLEPDRFRLSTGIGLRSIGIDHRFELIVALGTEPFADGADIESVRVALGSVTGF